MSPSLDLRVTIERVHVRSGQRADQRPAPVLITGHGGPSGPPGAPLHDHRIVIHELRIDIEAALPASGARHLGTQVAGELARQLAALQDLRLPQITRARSAGGPIYVETLHLRLRGEPAHHPPTHQISAALMTAFEETVRHAS